MKTLREMMDLIESAQNTGYRLELLDTVEDDDPESYSTMNVYYFDVYKDGKWVGRASGNDYFSDLYVEIDGKTTELDSQKNSKNPLMQQFKQHAFGMDWSADDNEGLEETELDPVRRVEELFRDKR